jgi:uncharacterized protein (TIGR03086 family)
MWPTQCRADVPADGEAVVQHEVGQDVRPVCECPRLDVEPVVGEEGEVDGGCAGALMPERDQDVPLESQVADAAQVALEAWRRRGLGGTVKLGSREVPAVLPVSVLSLEFLVHAWDFARATGRDVTLSEPVTDYALGLAGKVITPEARGFAGFAEPIDVPADASVLDRLIAFSGRQPAVVQTSAK